MRNLDEIIIHCTATRAKWWGGNKTSEKVAEIKRWHVDERGWSDIGYHFLIDRDGTVAKGRPLNKIGAHTRGHNRGSIGVSLFGGAGSSETDAFHENFTKEQEIALRGLIGDLKKKHGITKVSGHNEYAAKACPGFNVSRWMQSLDSEPEQPKSQVVVQKMAIVTPEVQELIDEASGEESRTDLLNKLQEHGSLFAGATAAASAFLQDVDSDKLMIIGGVIVACALVYFVSNYTRRSRSRKAGKALAAEMSIRAANQ